jgi:hypothetical protein
MPLWLFLLWWHRRLACASYKLKIRNFRRLQFLNGKFTKPLAWIAAAGTGTGFPHFAKIADASYVDWIGRFPQILHFRMVGIPEMLRNAIGLK